MVKTAIHLAAMLRVHPGKKALRMGNTRIFREWLPGNPDYELGGSAGVEWQDWMKGEKTGPDCHRAMWVPVRRKA